MTIFYFHEALRDNAHRLAVLEESDLDRDVRLLNEADDQEVRDLVMYIRDQP